MGGPAVRIRASPPAAHDLLSELITHAQRRFPGIQASAVIVDELAQVAVARIEIDEEIARQVVLRPEACIGGIAVAVRDRHPSRSDDAIQRVIQVGPGVSDAEFRIGYERVATEGESRCDVPDNVEVCGGESEIA